MTGTTHDAAMVAHGQAMHSPGLILAGLIVVFGILTVFARWRPVACLIVATAVGTFPFYMLGGMAPHSEGVAAQHTQHACCLPRLADKGPMDVPPALRPAIASLVVVVPAVRSGKPGVVTSNKAPPDSVTFV